MGNGACGNSRRELPFNPDEAEGGERFNSTLAALPKLFSETTTNGIKFLCTANVTPSFQRVIFACTDSKQQIYQKQVTQEELQNIREQLDVNHTIGWWQFFSALKHAFFNKKVSIMEYHSSEKEYNQGAASEVNLGSKADASTERDNSIPSSRKMNIELNFSTIGRTSLTLKLRRVLHKNAWGQMSDVFLYPLFDFYTIRTETSSNEKAEQLEKEIKVYKDKIAYHEQKTTGDYSSFATRSDHSDDQVTIPAGKITKFLKDIRKKLVETKAISTIEADSFNNVLKVISMDSLYNVEFPKQHVSNIDEAVMYYLKLQFSQQNDEVTRKKEPMQMVPASEFLKSSSISVQKTKEDIVAMFNNVDEWNYDVFRLDKLTGGHTLFITSYTLFVKYDLLNEFNIDETVLINFLREIESGYHHNMYHNAMHAADVLQVLHFIISKGGLAQYMSKEDILAALLSAIIHDYDHPGLNNAFQVNAQSYLATLYNDHSVLENHHCAQAFELLRSKRYNIFHGLSHEQKKDIRETVIQMVLATDMSQHAKIVGKFKGRLETDVDFATKEDVRLALQIAIKMADVSNPSRPTSLYLKWTQRITEEFYRQGNKERELHIPVSPLMDRSKPSLGKGQIAFMSYIVKPMFENCCQLLPEMKFSLDCISANTAYWESHDEIVIEE